MALGQRLVEVAARYRRETGVDVTGVAGGGAAGGLAGGLVALGARIEPGFDFVAGLVGLGARLERADLAVTGEGHLDPPSFHGKVPGGVLELARARGARAPRPCRSCASPAARTRRSSPHRRRVSTWSASPPASAGPGPGRETTRLISLVTAEALSRFCP